MPARRLAPTAGVLGNLVKTVLRAADGDPLAIGADDRIAGSAPDASPRIIFDVSSIARWVGPPVGIIRAEHALATFARAKRPDIVLAIYDSVTASFREISARWTEGITGWEGALDMVSFDFRRHWSRLRQCRSPRYPLVMALERRRLYATSARTRWLIDLAQKALWLRRQLPPPFADRHGRRLAVVPVDLALGKPLSLRPQDTLATAGYDWFNQDPVALERHKREHGFRYVVMCYDIIPLQFPCMFADHDVAAFRRYWDAMFPLADRILVNSRRVESDIRSYCAAAGLEIAETKVIPLGFDPPPALPRIQLPKGLEASRFVLFVSTLEPRKGHAMLVNLWHRLLAARIPQRHRFKLVFVGRRGWKVDSLLQDIDKLSAEEPSLVHFDSVSDDELSALYAAAAFCVYPSRYEGFGLPIIEAFSHGKAVIASTGGALPETVGGLSPCLDPGDEDAWFRELKRWIEDPQARTSYEAEIRATFSWPGWSEVAARFFEAVCDCQPRTARPIAP